jgi:hypothetical protein
MFAQRSEPKICMEGAPPNEKHSASFAARALHFAPRFFHNSILPLLPPRARSLLCDSVVIRSAVATVVVAVGAASLHRFWFMRQVRDVEKDAKEEELPEAQRVADDSDTELWEVEEPEASAVVEDAGRIWEVMTVDDLMKARTSSALDPDV